MYWLYVYAFRNFLNDGMGLVYIYKVSIKFWQKEEEDN